MARTADPALAERNAKIIADAKANPFQSDADLGRNYGVSPGLVYLIRKDAGLTNRERPKGRMKKEDRRALSPLHTLIGAKVHRTFHNQILETPGQPGIKEGDLAKILLLTPQRLAGVQLGIIDLTLTETPAHMRVAQSSNRGHHLRMCEGQQTISAEKALQYWKLSRLFYHGGGQQRALAVEAISRLVDTASPILAPRYRNILNVCNSQRAA